MKMSELIDRPWCLGPAGSVIAARCRDAFLKCGHQPPAQWVECNSNQLQIGLVATSGFLTMLPGSLIHFSADRLSIRALPINLDVPELPVGVITLANRTTNPVATIFVKTARDVARSMTRARRPTRASGVERKVTKRQPSFEL
jgi:DNA-binding transcriptional LysR family regulator